MYNTNIDTFSTALLSWYNSHQRDMPWRKTKNPYKIWLSEIMLQQTQVNTVIPYYQAWLKEFPTLESVAEAPLEKLLKKWEGLGYYSRCRNFHRAAKIVFEKHNREIPRTWKDFHELPGVGDYTVSVVLSICFNQPYPVLDANVKRVMARLLKKKKINSTIFINQLKKWIDKNNPGDFNQAMMDLGNQICRYNQAHCSNCPIKLFCKGTLSGFPESYPEKIKRKKIPHVHVVVGMIWNGDKFYIQKRPENKMLGGLWEFPGGKIKTNENLRTGLKRKIMEECLTEVRVGEFAGSIKHQYTHFSLTLILFHCYTTKKSLIISDQPQKWIRRNEIDNFPFPKANHKLFTLIKQEH